MWLIQSLPWVDQDEGEVGNASCRSSGGPGHAVSLGTPSLPPDGQCSFSLTPSFPLRVPGVPELCLGPGSPVWTEFCPDLCPLINKNARELAIDPG